MAQLLHHQESVFYGKELQGCRWSIFQFFGLRRRLRSTKMLSDKKHSQGKDSGGSRRRSSYVSLKDEDNGAMDNEKYTEVKKKHKASKKNSGKASLRSLVLKKLYGKEGQKEKMLPVAPKLLRTLSIHYLESNEYVLDGEFISNGDGSTLSMQNATNTLDGCDSDTSSLLLKRGDSYVKRKSHRSISMDGVLHKIPYGQNLSGDVIREELPRSASATYDRDGLKPYFGTAAKRPVNQGFRRSRSLTESLESYSHLLDSISNSQHKKTLTSSKSTRDHSVDGPAVMTGLQRTSNAVPRTKDSVKYAENHIIPKDALVSHVTEGTAADGDVNVAMDESSNNEVADGSENNMLLEEYMNNKRCGIVLSTEANVCTAPLLSEVVDIPEENTSTCDDDLVPSSTEVDLCTSQSTSEEFDVPEEHATTCDDDHIQSSTEVDLCTAQSASEEFDVPEEHATTCDDDHIHSSTEVCSSTSVISEDGDIVEEHKATSDDKKIQSSDLLKSTEGTFCVPDPNQEIGAEKNLSCEQETDSPMSVLDVTFSDFDPASQVKYKNLDDSSLEPRTLNLNDADDSAGIVINASTSTELSATDLTKKNLQESGFDELNFLQADQKNEDELNYVKDIFLKSSFSNEILFDEWYSQNIVALQEEDCQHYEASAAAFEFTDMSADQLLLFDLTNEALLEIYKKYSACKSKLSWFSSFDRPKPVGNKVVKELCSKVSCHLDEQPQSSIEIDTILSNDLAKSDPLVNFPRDSDHLGNKLADFVFDRLLTELTLELAKF